jgi:hypothetical protein
MPLECKKVRRRVRSWPFISSLFAQDHQMQDARRPLIMSPSRAPTPEAALTVILAPQEHQSATSIGLTSGSSSSGRQRRCSVRKASIAA